MITSELNLTPYHDLHYLVNQTWRAIVKKRDPELQTGSLSIRDGEQEVRIQVYCQGGLPQEGENVNIFVIEMIQTGDWLPRFTVACSESLVYRSLHRSSLSSDV